MVLLKGHKLIVTKPDKIQIVSGLPKTRSGKIMRRILRKVAEGDVNNLGDTSTLLDPNVVEEIKTMKFAAYHFNDSITAMMLKGNVDTIPDEEEQILSKTEQIKANPENFV